ncbi:hypothetical protein [Paenibacillus sp. LPE1-1-1.1]|uniref:hypothetical protein n=1 Tax=Paenibacillus sp. LPE1-1-1.1 TaxID=3135230 RepID=UPI0034483D6E
MSAATMRADLEDPLSLSTDREREYVQKQGDCFSFAEITDILYRSKGSVEAYVQCAQK